MPKSWPPARRPSDRTVGRRTGTDIGAPVVELREVLLWGRPVLIDEAGDVWCTGCLRTVPIPELMRVDSHHRVRPPGWSEANTATWYTPGGPDDRTPPVGEVYRW
ncbi:MAG: hypothetical protein JWP40_974 [Blastococcus sp.]|nr:hypothetical protein [Blastococcus sp.]